MFWNKRRARPTIIGNPPSRSRVVDLGAGSGQRWSPRTHTYYEQQWRNQRGAWGEPEAAERLQADIDAVVEAFQTRGSAAGLREAHRRGLNGAGKVYLDIRSETEEELAARLARLRVRLVQDASLADKLAEAFVRARLDEVRAAQSKGHTPPQAVADLPDIPRKSVPRWVPIAAFVLSAVSFVISVGSAMTRRTSYSD